METNEGRYDLTMDGRIRWTAKADGTGPFIVLSKTEVRDRLSTLAALLREARSAGPPKSWPIGRQVRWAAEVDGVLSAPLGAALRERRA